jgi:hypothetical protein
MHVDRIKGKEVVFNNIFKCVFFPQCKLLFSICLANSTKTQRRFQGVPRWDYNINKFSTRIDGDFFVSDYPELLRGAPKKPTLIGVSESEALLFSKFFE